MASSSDLINSAIEQGQNVYENVCAQTGINWLARALQGIAIALGILLPFLFSIVAFCLTNVGVPFADAVVRSMDEVRNDPSSAMNKLIVDLMGEFFGPDFDKSTLGNIPGTASNLDQMRALGAAIFTMLQTEFTPGGAVNPEQGLQGAQAFLGFAANFGVRSAFLGLLGEIETFGKVDAFRELGEDVAKNIGLGRLVRGALRPLVQTTISIPLTWKLNQDYRPKRMDETQLVRAHNRGALDDATFAEQMAQLGYADDDFQRIVDYVLTRPSSSDWWTLIRHTIENEDAATAALTTSGYSPSDAVRVLHVHDAMRADAWVLRLIEAHGKSYVNGHMDQGTFYGFVDTFPLGPTEKIWVKQCYDSQRQVPHRALTIGEAARAFEENVIDLGDFEQYLVNAGFSTDDASALVNIALIAQAKLNAPKTPKKPPAKTTPPPPAAG